MTTTLHPLKILLTGASLAALIGNSALAQTPTLVQLEKALVAARTEAEWPGLNTAEAAKNLKTPEAALSFVRDAVNPADYHGSFHGSDGTLRTRTANNEDKALLLAALLRAQGYQTELVFAPRPAGFTLHPPKGLNRSRPELVKLQTLIAPLAANLSPMTTEEVLANDKAQAETLLKEVATAKALVTKELNHRNWKPVVSSPGTEKAPRWIWVRARKGNTDWQNFAPYSDVTQFPNNPGKVRLTSAQVRLVVYSSDPLGKKVGLVAWEGKSHDLAGHDIRLGWLPYDKRVQSLSDLKLPLSIKVKQWIPVLQVGAKTQKGNVFTPSTVTAHASPKRPTIRVRISINNNGKLQTFDRVIQDLGSGFDQHAWIASHHIGYAVAGVPSSVVESRVMDELLDNVRLKLYTKGGVAPIETSGQRGYSTRTTRVVNKMIKTALELDPKGKNLSWHGPTLFIETVRLRKQGDKVESYTLLDMVHQAFAPKPSTPAEDKIRWGLAVCAAEGQLVDNKSVNHHLISGDQPISQILESNGDDMIGNALANESAVLARASSNQHAWIVKSDGTLLGIVSPRPLLQAKGGEGQGNRVAAGTAAYVALSTGALAAGGASPLGPMVGGIAGYLNELRKAWNGAAAKINRVADLINGGSGDINAKDDYDFKNLAPLLLKAMGEGYAKGYASSAISSTGGALVNAEPGGRAAIATGVSLLGNTATMKPNDIRAIFAAQ